MKFIPDPANWRCQAGNLRFLAEAYFRCRIASASPFPGAVFRDVAYTLSDQEKPVCRFLLSDGQQEYLADETLRLLSEGYHEIIPLTNKMPFAPGFMVSSFLKYGVIGFDGKVLIPCSYTSVNPLCCHSYISGESDEDTRYINHTMLFYVCRKQNGLTDVFAADGTPVFENISDIHAYEERVHYYAQETDCEDDNTVRVYNKSIQMESIRIFTPCAVPGSYADGFCYDIKYSDTEAKLTGGTIVLNEWDTAPDSPPPAPDPLAGRVPLFHDFFIGRTTEIINGILRILTADEAVWQYIDHAGINYNWSDMIWESFGSAYDNYIVFFDDSEPASAPLPTDPIEKLRFIIEENMKSQP